MARIAVIGAGLGAMATAARLAVAGHRVTVYERSSTYGGAVGLFERDGFAFDTGPALLHLPAVWRDLFVKTGKEPLEQCVDLAPVDPASRHLFADGTDVRLPNASRAGLLSALDAALGAGAGERWGDFLGRAGQCWDRTRRPLLEEPLRDDWQVLGRDPYPALRQRRLLRRERQASTLAEIGAWELADPRLAALLGSYASEFGLDPATAPASAALLPYMEQSFGAWYVKGGMRALARAVYERCLARKVEFVFEADIVRIVAEDGHAAGVELADGTVAEAAHVVAGAAPGQAPLPDGLWRDGDVRPRGTAGAFGRFSVLLALRGGRDAGAAHRTVVHGDGPVATVAVVRPDDPGTRPDADHEAVTVTATVPYGDGDGGGDPAGLAEALLDAAERAVPGVRERELWREVRAPRAGGPLAAPSLAGAEGAYLHPGNRTRLPGLYLAGGWAHPGGGLAHAGMSGALVAGLIVEGDGFKGSQ
ncbi:phytoene desaturase family protein [Streptomyces sp. NPDC050504]|uniref:phytoene desaturase family protein n=1 Tax=Streptomyces sp. NPDC050504 TaxID=3365618 RepID=UPI0037BCBE15